MCQLDIFDFVTGQLKDHDPFSRVFPVKQVLVFDADGTGLGPVRQEKVLSLYFTTLQQNSSKDNPADVMLR